MSSALRDWPAPEHQRAVPPTVTSPPYLAESLALLSTSTGDESWWTDRAVPFWMSTHAWAELGMNVSDALVESVTHVWGARPHCVPLLTHLVAHYPHRRFIRLFQRLARQPGDADAVDYPAWSEAFPETTGLIRDAVVQRAASFNHGRDAIEAALVWGRYLDGDQAAWEAVAKTIRREDHRRKHDLRHDLEDHGRLSVAEAESINTALEGYGSEPLKVIERGHRWQRSAPQAWKSPERRADLLAVAVDGASRWASGTLSDAAVEYFAARLNALPSDVRADFPQRSAALRRVWDAAG